MKANELMIGDWILYEGETKQIVAIPSDNEVIFDGTLEKYVSDCLPILLTPEILEKNGFTDGKYRHFNGNVWKLEADGFRKIHLTENVGQAVLWGEKIDPDYPNSVGDKFTIPFIRYVHELQHVLRLCGIEKEIVLWN